MSKTVRISSKTLTFLELKRCQIGLCKITVSPFIKLTNILLGGKIKLFREEEHPRDNDGKFTDKKLQDMSAKELSESIKIDIGDNQPINKLTNVEKALYYKAIQKNERKEYTAEVQKINNNTRAVFVDTKERAVLIVDENKAGKIVLVKTFSKYDEMLDYFNEVF